MRRYKDQADNLREQMEETKNQEDKQPNELDVTSLPPRSEIHRGKKSKKRSRKVDEKQTDTKEVQKENKPSTFPLFLLFLFLILVTLAMTSHIWLEYLP
ncbi:hypothetical protein [Bacillus alkalicellulosilyticus]|uniref:hypothetical protein n=1 Tax=Alkalihalobacterium alkalicellulosilyticum TaxID=1912214 RepID=UPI0009960AAD|nr:hypothetical protein [Bacillus alkalicellulosilyticus]